MKKIPFLLLVFLAACSLDQNETPVTSDAHSSNNSISVDLSEQPELQYENMQIYPIMGDADFIAQNEVLAGFKNLKEGIEINGFRITEKKPFGRFEDPGAVNTLTVQNKSQDTIILMEGDVVEGGNQDRMLAQHMVVPPRTISDIPVFCVEKGRWNYRPPAVEGEAGPQELALSHREAQNRKVGAFTGYYNIASTDLRRTMKQTNNQQAVWDKVGDLTAINNAESSTGTYANLKNSSDFVEKRDSYRSFFFDKFEEKKEVIGMLVVSGNEIIGVDVFGHPDLFAKQYPILLDAYITDVISKKEDKVTVSAKTVERYAQKLQRELGKSNEDVFEYNGAFVHYSE